MILPPTVLHDLLNRPDNEIDALEVQIESLQAQYTIPNDRVLRDNYHFDVVRKQITRNLPIMTQGIAEEIDLAFKRYWGTSTEWKSVQLLETCLKIVARTANRAFLGTELCEDVQSSIRWC